MKKPPIPGWESTTVTEEVPIPTPDGKGIAYTVPVQVPVWRDPKSGMIFHDEQSRQVIDKAKARHMGILSRAQIKEIREMLGLTQQGMAELLQLGAKTWTRWETGKERPSRSMNLLLCAIFDGKVDAHYLRRHQDPRERWARQWKMPERPSSTHFITYAVSPSKTDFHETEAIPA